MLVISGRGARLVPRRWLQARCAGLRFSMAFVPPWLRGVTWSMDTTPVMGWWHSQQTVPYASMTCLRSRRTVVPPHSLFIG